MPTTTLQDELRATRWGALPATEQLQRCAAECAVRMPRRAFEWLLNTSIAVNRYLLVPINERLGHLAGLSRQRVENGALVIENLDRLRRHGG